MQKSEIISVLEAILSQPTAPFHEYYVRGAIRQQLADCEHVEINEDAFGNLIATYRFGEDPAPVAWAFGSHMDHPGWVRTPDSAPEPEPESAHRQFGDYTFLGGVPAEYFHEPRLREYGDFAMWDLAEFETQQDGRIVSRACDDLVGCAAIICALKELESRNVEAVCHGLFTRAEEVGFVGAIELARSWSLGPDVVFVSIETSVAASIDAMGQGPMCRVGDRLSIFDSDATAALLKVAESDGLAVQRALLDKGSCEATALQAYGIRTAGISVPLGNYHNCGPGKRIQPEFVHYQDVETLVHLMAGAVGQYPGGFPDPGAELRERFQKRVDAHGPYIHSAKDHFSSISAAEAQR